MMDKPLYNQTIKLADLEQAIEYDLRWVESVIKDKGKIIAMVYDGKRWVKYQAK